MPTPIPTVPVTCSARDQTGAPLAGGKFEATLDRVERYGGFLVPQVSTGIADADGVCVLDLWPNSLGTAGSTYRVRAWHGVTGTRYLDAAALVPNAACALQDILIAQPLPPVNEARQALAAAQAALAPVTEQARLAGESAASAALAAADALGSADRADDAKNAAEIAAVAALTHSQSAALYSFEATTAADAVQADVVTVLAQVSVATGSAASAQADSAAAALSAGVASGHADTAQQQAVVAVQASADADAALIAVASHASAVAADKTATAAAALQAQSNATAALASAGTANAAKDSATASANTATTQAASAVAAAGAIGPIAFYDTYAAANSAVGGLVANALVEVAADETKAGARTRYRKAGAALAFVVNLDSVRADLAQADSGAGLVGVPVLGDSDASGTVLGELRRKAYEVRLLNHLPVTLAAPHYQVLSTIADGNVSNAFPSVARHNGVDYVFYRAGVQHTGNDGVIRVHQVDVNTGLRAATTTVLDLSYDSRDPCVLTDDYGRAVLVGGVMKVVVFHALNGVANRVSVYDFDPANVAAGFVNRVDMPTTIIAAKTDVKPLAAGGYGLIGYAADNKCYWVTTTDWASFNIEIIGRGNECAWGQESSGTVVVISRQEVAPYFAKIYKKPQGGNWALHGDIPYRLAAPTLRKTATLINSNETASTSGQHAGWLLLAKDRRESPSMSNLDLGSMKLVAMISRNDYGRVINDFATAQDVMGMHEGSLKDSPVGDSFYAAAVTSEFGTDVTIYAHMQISRDVFQPNGSYVIKIVRLQAKLRGGLGLITALNYLQPENKCLNGDFQSANFWQVGQNSSISNSLLTLTNSVVSQSNNQIIFLEPGQYRIFVRARRVSGDGSGTNQHLAVKILATGSVLLSSLAMQGTAARLGSDFHILRGQPFEITSSGLYTLQVVTEGGVAVTEVDWVYVGKADDLFSFVDVQDKEKVLNMVMNFSGVVGGTPPVFTATYSASFWDVLGYRRDVATGRPFAFQTPQEALDALRIISVRDSSATPKNLLVRSFAVNANYSITAELEQYPSQSSGTIAGPLSIRIESRMKMR